MKLIRATKRRMPPQPPIKLQCWAARDKDGYLALYSQAPICDKHGNWGGCGAIRLPIYMWPELSHDNGAVDVDITVKVSRR